MRHLRAIAVAAAVLGAPLSSDSQNGYVERTLFAVDYSWEPEKIGNYPHMLSEGFEQGSPLLCRILVSDEGTVWLGEAKNCLVKGYTRDGAFTRIVGRHGLKPSDLPHAPHEVPKTHSERPWEFAAELLGFAIDRRGYSYLLINPDTRAIPFDPKGQVVLSHGMDGITWELRGWEKMCYRLRQEMNVVWPVVEDVRCDSESNVYLAVAADGGAAAAGRETKLAKFTPALDFAGWRPGRYVGSDGSTYQFVNRTAERAGHALRRFAPDGSHAGTVRLVPPAGAAASEYRPEDGWRIPDGVLIDGRRNIYLCFSGPAAETTDADVWPKAHVAVRVYVFSRDGSFMSRVSLPLVAKTSSPPCVAVDSGGVIYYAVYRHRLLEVRRQEWTH